MTSMLESTSAQTGPMVFKLRKVVDPRTDIEDIASLDQEYLGYVGAQYWNRYVIPCTSVSESEIKWTNIQSPGPRMLWDKKWFVEYIVKIDINNMPVTSTDLYPFRGSDSVIMFRPYPLHQCADTIQVSLNNRTITVNPRETLNARMEYWPQDKLKLSNGMCPHRKYNGQTFADMELRKGNSPFCNMGEFNDQDYPNTALINVISTEFKPGTVARGSDFERGGIPRSIRVNQDLKYDNTNVDGNQGTAIDYNKTGDERWGVYTIPATVGTVLSKYIAARAQYIKEIGLTQYKAVSANDRYALKQQAGNAVAGVKPTADTTYPAIKMGDFIDLDFLTVQEAKTLIDCYQVFYHEDYAKAATVYEYQSLMLTPGSYHLTAKIREPVIAEPLDFTSSAEFGRTMWNINSVELKYTLSTYLRNMIAIDDYKLFANSDAYWQSLYGDLFIKGKNRATELLTDENIKVSLVDKPNLIYNIATPFTAPNCPFVCQHKQFQRYESHTGEQLNVKTDQLIDNYMDPEKAKKAVIKVTSDAYPLQFHPNSIFVWVAQRSSDRYKGSNRYTRVDSYAKINRIKISYGNASNMLAQFDDHELFQMSLRNGLQDRSFLDWNATTKSITVPTDYYGNSDKLGLTFKTYYDTVQNGALRVVSTESTELPSMNRYAGIGSVVRLIPGIDILTGDSTNPLIAGMHAYSQTIQLEVDFIPLNAYEETDYSLYVMFEYDGVCTINPGTCDLGMIAIDSWSQLKATPKARTMRESYAYGAGLGDKVLSGLRSAFTIMKNAGIQTKRGNGYINSVGNLGKSAKMSGGKLISSGQLWRNY